MIEQKTNNSAKIFKTPKRSFSCSSSLRLLLLLLLFTGAAAAAAAGGTGGAAAVALLVEAVCDEAVVPK